MSSKKAKTDPKNKKDRRKRKFEVINETEEKITIERERREAEELEKILFGESSKRREGSGKKREAKETALGKDLLSVKDIIAFESLKSEEGDNGGAVVTTGVGEGEGEGEGEREGVEVELGAGLVHDRKRQKIGKKETKEAVWVDEEDKEEVVNVSTVNRLRKLRKNEGEKVILGTEYVSRLRSQYVKMNKGTEWAQSLLKAKLKKKTKEERRESEGYEREDEEDEGDEDEEEEEGGGEVLLQADGFVEKVSNSRLAQGMLETTRMRDANQEDPCKGVVQSVQFHPNGQLLLTGSLDKTVRLFQIDGKKNPKVQGVFLEDMPIHKAVFSSNGAQIFASGRRKWFYVYDLEGGRIEKVNGIVGRDEKSWESFQVSPDNSLIAFLGNNGHIVLVSQKTRQWIGNLKMNGSVRNVCFTPDSKELVSSGGDGEIYHWDLGTRRCFHRGKDEGCHYNTSLDLSKDGKFIASGSNTGVVNLYERKAFVGGVTKPVKCFLNITMGIDNVKFNHDTQMLAMSSKMKKDSMRLAHVSSKTVFSNWPTSRTPLSFVQSLDFSPLGGYLAVGNAKGKVLLYRLHHYDRA